MSRDRQSKPAIDLEPTNVQAKGDIQAPLETPLQKHGSEQTPEVTAPVDAGVAAIQMMQKAGGNQATVQAKERAGAKSQESVLQTASQGVAGGGTKMPHADKIQASFGQHNISDIEAYTGPAVQKSADALGARAYATGNKVAFGESPSLHLAAHEAAHVVQQKAGVSLKGNVGQAGDKYEQHADAVADAVVQGKSAEGLLSSMVGGGVSTGTVQSKEVQFLGKGLDEELGDKDAVPEYGETKGKQRRYSREQYIAMWEEEQGRAMTPAERRTIERGCIGITATNLQGGGNPLGNAEELYGSFEQGHKSMVEKNKVRDEMRARGQLPAGMAKARYVLFAKLFWSNQNPDYEERVKPDEDAFKPDPKTGEVDMTGYAYRARVKKDLSGGYVNFDYGFWDDTSQCFWHANHMEHKDPAKRASDPMKVLQSTSGKFIKGYFDFDRIAFGVALAENYDPGLAAISHVASGGG
jgi:hypothetical protein